jgi:hypothetical protein
MECGIIYLYRRGGFMEKLIKNSHGQWSLVQEPMLKTSTNVRSAVKWANTKLRDAGIKEGGYGVTSAGTPHWDYEYHPDKHKEAVNDAHSLVSSYLPKGHTHEDYQSDDGMRHTYGGDPGHVNATAEKHPEGVVSTSKKLR